MTKRLFITYSLWLLAAVAAVAQISGAVIDAQSGDSITAATVRYKNHRINSIADQKGRYTIERHDGWKMQVSAVGYKTATVPISAATPSRHFDIRLTPDNNQLDELFVKSSKSKYSRKENPAVELMRRVIAAKKQTDLKRKPYYSYTKYNKLKLALNNMNARLLEKEGIKKREWLGGQFEVCEQNGLLIMPLIVQEKVTKELYRKSPKAEKTIIMGDKAQGLNELMQTGDMATVMSGDIFSSIDIYEDQMRLLRQYFTSPIGKDAISFYRYYIEDTLLVGRDSCIHLTFLPNNQQDIGFRGDLYVVKDETLHVKKVRLGLPKTSIINFVDNIVIDQEYEHIGLKDDWVMTRNDMFIELSLVAEQGQAVVINTSRYYDYSFGKIADAEFKGSAAERYEADAERRGEDFWTSHRGDTQLTQGEQHTGSFIDGLKRSKGFGWISWVLKAFIENFIETSPTGKPSYFEIGPVNTLVSFNDMDGVRMRIGGQTTANLHRHLFLKGYYARGFDTRKNYYDATLTYSITPKKHLPLEYPRNNIALQSSFDICNPSDRFATTDKDNIFTAARWTDTQKMMFYNRQKLSYIYEVENGFKLNVSAKCEENEATGGLFFRPLSDFKDIPYTGGHWEDYYQLPRHSLHNGKMRTTEFTLTMEYAPGARFFSSKQHQVMVSRDVPIFTLTHTMGVKGLLGGQYDYNVTEAKIYKRFILNSWGTLTCHLKGGIQWSQVPYPLLLAPAANLSYMSAPSAETFNLVNGAEFMNDRYVSLSMAWKMNGKLFNRVPLLKKLRLREYLALKALWGNLSDKNNPQLSQNWHSSKLMAFPEGYNVMNPKKPYIESAVGIHGIFKFLNIDYVHRFTYLDLPSAHRDGVRFSFEFTF